MVVRQSVPSVLISIGRHTFRAMDIVDHVAGGRIELAERVDGHPHTKTTRVHDRRNNGVGSGRQ